MPLTLDCVCPDENIAVCELTQLTLVVDISEAFIGDPIIAASHTLTFYANKDDPSAATITMENPVAGEYMFDLPLADWAPHWDKISVELDTTAGSFQVPAPAFSAYDKLWATYYIKQDYVCTNPANPSGTTHPFDKAYTTEPGDTTKCEPTVGDLRVVCYAGQGVGSLFYKSTVLGICFGCTVVDKTFKPAVDASGKVDISTGTWCICASGGSGNYVYSLMKGALPTGMTLDANSGCVSGKPTGSNPGTRLFTFGVLDLTTHNTAQVNCGILGLVCPGSGLGNQAY